MHHRRDDGLLMVGSNDGVALPMPHLQGLVNLLWALAQLPGVGDLSLAVSTTGVALSQLLLIMHDLPQRATMRLVRVNTLVKQFIAQ